MLKNKSIKIGVLLAALHFPLLLMAQQGSVVLTIDECRQLAYSRSAQMQNASLDIEAAKFQREEARAEYFPRVSVAAFGFYALDPMLEIGVEDLFGKSDLTAKLQDALNKISPELGINPIYRTLQRGAVASLSLMQPVFAGGRIVAGNKLAVLGVEAASLQYNINKRMSDEQIDQLYWQVVALQEKQNTLYVVENMLDTIYRDVLSAHEAGIAGSTDLMQVELKRSELRVGMLQLENGIRLAKMNILNGIGMEYSYISRDGTDLPFIDSIYFSANFDKLMPPEECYVPEEDVALSQDEMKLLDLSVRAKQLERRMILGEALPQVAVGANYGYSYMFDKNNWNGAIFAMVQIPLSDWGKNARKLQRYDRMIKKTENDKIYLSEQILLQVRQLWLNLNTAWQQMLVIEQSMSVAESVFNQTNSYYRAGMASVSELLQTQSALQQAREAYITQKLDYAKALNSYLYRTGKR